MPEQVVNYTDKTKLCIGNIDVKKGVIGSLEEKYLGTELIGRLEKVGGGTDIDELMNNIVHVLKLNVNTGSKNEFLIERNYDEVIPKVTVWTRAYNSTTKGEVYLYPAENHMIVEVECVDSPRADAVALKRGLNEVIKNAVVLEDGWGN